MPRPTRRVGPNRYDAAVPLLQRSPFLPASAYTTHRPRLVAMDRYVHYYSFYPRYVATQLLPGYVPVRSGTRLGSLRYSPCLLPYFLLIFLLDFHQSATHNTSRLRLSNWVRCGSRLSIRCRSTPQEQYKLRNRMWAIDLQSTFSGLHFAPPSRPIDCKTRLCAIHTCLP